MSSKCLKLESELNFKTDKKITESKKRENKLTVRKRNKRVGFCFHNTSLLSLIPMQK